MAVVKKSSRSSRTIEKKSRFDRPDEQRKPAERGRDAVKIVPEPQPTPERRQVPSKEILRRRRDERDD